MRPIDEIVVHCADTRPDWWMSKSLGQKIAEVRRWHTTPPPLGRGWSDVGYHFLIDRDGRTAKGRLLGRVGAHVLGHNHGSIGICLFGGHGAAATDRFQDHFTPEQDDALRTLIAQLRQNHSIDRVTGHNQYAAKACPGFSVPAWY